MVKSGYKGLPRRTFVIVGMSFLFMAAVFFVNSVGGITGYAVFSGTDYGVGFLIALWFLFAGMAVLGMAGRGENEAQDLLENRKILTKYNDLRRLADRMGYDLKEGGNHATVLDSDHHVVTQIPRHTNVNRNTARGIMRKLAEEYAA
jgi:hypothetical protein